MKVVLTGSLAIDRIMDFPGRFGEHIMPDKIHQLSVSFNIEKLEEKRGGTAGNVAYSLALLGEQPKIVASAGNDFGSYLDYLKGLGLDVSGIELQPGVTTASAYITTDQDNNQITAFFMGAMAAETTAEVASHSDDTVFVLSAGNKRDMLRYAAESKAAGRRYMFDPGQTLPFLEPDEIRTLINGAYILVMNDYELEMILKRAELTLGEVRGQVEVLITTLGKNGSRIEVGGETVEVPTAVVNKVQDPTGAGDAYRAGLLKGLIHGLSWEQCGKLGALAATYAIEHYGTQEHRYDIAEFGARYKDSFGETCPLVT